MSLRLDTKISRDSLRDSKTIQKVIRVLYLRSPYGTVGRIAKAFVDPSASGFIEFEHPNAIPLIVHRLKKDEARSREHARWMNIWWKRLSVIQELDASRNTANVLIRPHSMKWHLYAELLWGGEKMPAPFALQSYDTSRSLDSLMGYTTPHFACKNHRDRIYALLSLCNDKNLPLTELMYAEVTEYLIRKHGGPDVLLDADSFTNKTLVKILFVSFNKSKTR